MFFVRAAFELYNTRNYAKMINSHLLEAHMQQEEKLLMHTPTCCTYGQQMKKLIQTDKKDRMILVILAIPVFPVIHAKTIILSFALDCNNIESGSEQMHLQMNTNMKIDTREGRQAATKRRKISEYKYDNVFHTKNLSLNQKF